MVEFTEGPIHDVVVAPLEPFVDERGWLTEIFRHDELPDEFHPAMAYISLSKPGVTRGPHEHVDQADLFAFLGPSNFQVELWDPRSGSPSRGRHMRLLVGEDKPCRVLVPKGVVHGYRNVGAKDGIVWNCPNRLFMGPDKSQPIDEIRHEDEPNSPYKMGA